MKQSGDARAMDITNSAQRDRKARKRKRGEEDEGSGETDRPASVAKHDLQPDDKDQESREDRKARKAAKKIAKALKKANKQEKRRLVQDSTTPTPREHSDQAIEDTPGTTPELMDVDQSEQSSPYDCHPTLEALPQGDIDSFMGKNQVDVADPQSKSILRPILSFQYLPSKAESLQSQFKGFKEPTPIQAVTWPYLFAGRDIVGVAETGSGKTLAFSVPCIQHIYSLPKAKRKEGAKAVIVSPTRELAVQIYDQIVKLASLVGLTAVCVYGGVQKEEQRRLLKTASIIVATPGRLNDLINEGSANLSQVQYLILDEADRMLDKGFEEEIKKIISATPAKSMRQTLMFTATWPPSVRALASIYMKSPVKITIGDNADGDLRANTRIVQRVQVVEPWRKEQLLVEILKRHQQGGQQKARVLVFCLYKKEATRVEGNLRAKGFKVAGIHGDLGQAQRMASLEAFKSGQTPILVATDVAARGLDIPAVKLVLNVTFPLTVEDYVHRIGRTGRAGAEGLAITLFTEHDKAHSGSLINVMKAANQPVPDELMKFGTTVKRKGHDAYGAFYKDTDGTKTATKIKFDD